MFSYPFRPHVLAWAGGFALVALLIHAIGSVVGPLGMLLSGLWWIMVFKVASESLLDGASGREDDADRPERFAGDGQALRHIVLWILLALVGVLCRVFGGNGALWLWCAAVTLVLPAAIVMIAMEDSLLSGLNPVAWFELMRRIGTEYLLVAAALTGLCVALGLLHWAVFERMPPWLGVPVSRFVLLLLLFGAYHALGALLHRHREALELPDERAIQPIMLATKEEDLAMREAEQLAAEDQFALAAARLDPLIRGQGASPPVHARYRELLTRVDDREGLLRHARGYVAVLLTLGKEREALALYLASRSADPGFELEEPQKVSDLIALAARNQQSKLAVTLAEEFARRFPRDRDFVLNGLTAARLMDRLDRDDDARRLLLDLVERFPEHALRKQLDEALQALDAQLPPRTP